MKFKILNLITVCCFGVAFVSLMLSYLLSFMFYVTSFAFCAGFVLLSIILAKNYMAQKNMREEKQEAIVMQLAEGEDGEKYVMQTETNSKKERRRKARANFEALIPTIFSVLLGILFAYVFISSIIKLF